jgi:hypothetical protein
MPMDLPPDLGSMSGDVRRRQRGGHGAVLHGHVPRLLRASSRTFEGVAPTVITTLYEMDAMTAMVTLDDDPKLSETEILRDLETTWGVRAAEAPQERDGAIVFHVGTAMVAVGRIAAPIPWSQLEGPCATSWIWPDATTALKRHSQHVIVSVISDTTPIERARLLTQVTASVLETCKAATGVYWGAATLVVRADMFRKFAVKVLPEGPPVHVWVDFRVGSNPDGTSFGFTAGLSGLGLMDIETQNAPERPGVLRERFINLADYLLENGPVIRDGHTVGGTGAERIGVRYAESLFGDREQVMRLVFPTGEHAPKRPWWKFG